MNQTKMPIIFLGHGSPMNAIENNIYSSSWREIGKSISQKPRAIIMFSAHWITNGITAISSNNHPKMIYDMYGFPAELYKITYPAPGNQELAQEIRKELELSLGKGIITEDKNQGLDHGVWSTLMHVFPQADIPVICISLDYSQSPEWLYNLGKSLSNLREQGILFIGSGNIVHNLSLLNWSGTNQGYDWAVKFDERISQAIKERRIDELFTSLSWKDISLAHPTHDHLLPLFPLLGATKNDDSVEFFTPTIDMGSLSMRSILWR